MQLGDRGVRKQLSASFMHRCWVFFCVKCVCLFIDSRFAKVCKRKVSKTHTNIFMLIGLMFCALTWPNKQDAFGCVSFCSTVAVAAHKALPILHFLSPCLLYPPRPWPSVHTSVWALSLQSVTEVILLALLSPAFRCDSWSTGPDTQSCISNRGIQPVGVWEVNEIASSWRLVCLIHISFQNYGFTNRHTIKNLLLPWISHHCYANFNLCI